MKYILRPIDTIRKTFPKGIQRRPCSATKSVYWISTFLQHSDHRDGNHYHKAEAPSFHLACSSLLR